MPRRALRRSATAAGIAVAVTAAAVAGFAAASFLVAGPDKIAERAPVGAIRGLVGDEVGRDAAEPFEIPPAGWIEILGRTAIMFATTG